MTVAPARPPLARKHTRSTEANRAAALDEGIRISIDDHVYEVRVGDLNALHSRALRQQVGMSFTRLTEMLDSDPDLDLVAAIVWLARYMGGETDLTYNEVAVDIDLDFIERADISETAAEELSDSPEG